MIHKMSTKSIRRLAIVLPIVLIVLMPISVHSAAHIVAIKKLQTLISSATVPTVEETAEEEAITIDEFLLDDIVVEPLTVSPVPWNTKLSSRFGIRQERSTGQRTFHAGLDFIAPLGTPVLAVRAGIVEKVARNRQRNNGFSGYGNAIVIYHEDEDLWSFYAHMHRIDVTPGERVNAGDMIGRIGATSNRLYRDMAIHLHFEIRKRDRNDKAPFPGIYRRNNLNPERWLATHGIKYNRRGFLEMPESFVPETGVETDRTLVASQVTSTMSSSQPNIAAK